MSLPALDLRSRGRRLPRRLETATAAGPVHRASFVTRPRSTLGAVPGGRMQNGRAWSAGGADMRRREARSLRCGDLPGRVGSSACGRRRRSVAAPLTPRRRRRHVRGSSTRAGLIYAPAAIVGSGEAQNERAAHAHLAAGKAPSCKRRAPKPHLSKEDEQADAASAVAAFPLARRRCAGGADGKRALGAPACDRLQRRRRFLTRRCARHAASRRHALALARHARVAEAV